MTARTDGAMVALSSAVALVAVTFYGSAVLGADSRDPAGPRDSLTFSEQQRSTCSSSFPWTRLLSATRVPM